MSTTRPADDRGPRIGPYRTVRELGRGGQAIVWLAEDSRIGRQVALKVLPYLGPGAEEALRRFRREAEVAARLEHPAICAVLEADLDQGTPYIAMRYVAGETLARRLSRERDLGAPPPDRDALRTLASFFEKTARALHAAHEAGIVHRDVKPANVMVTPEGEPVILDFGLAREDDAAGQAQSLSGELSGTPAYMSPEQMTGRSRPDRRTDVWSLGVALYEAATRTHPFAAATRESLFQSILNDDPSDARRINTQIDRDFATILETATAKERDRRYQTALDFAEDLRRWRTNEPIRARAVGRMERLGRWMQRKPALAASIAATLVLLLASSAFLFYGIGAAGRADVEAGLRSVAEAAQQRAETERARADAARLALEQVQSDRALADELDELNMQMGTLWFGLREEASVSALAPKYLAAFARYGIDFERDESATHATLRLAALRTRDLELWSMVQGSLSNLSSVLELDESTPATRIRVAQARDAFPEVRWPALETAVARWESEQVDEFGSLLAEDVLATKSPDQLYELAAKLLLNPARLGDATAVLERALERAPGSFRLHFLISALGFMQVAEARARDPESANALGAKLLHHMQVAVALRPRSGFVRAMLANAFAVNTRYVEAMHCMDDATELEPDNALVWLFRARFYSYTPSPEVGVAACKQALALEPNLDGAKKLLAELEARVK
ncbi:MAG: protein kinase domain-containing protein [Planctomycetota bacterium]